MPVPYDRTCFSKKRFCVNTIIAPVSTGKLYYEIGIDMIIRKTRSVCPVGFKNISAVLDRRSGVVFMEKTCPEHGDFSVPVWHDKTDMDDWRSAVPQLQENEGTGCPGSCGTAAI